MISYKTWQTLNESFGFNLGVGSVPSVGGPIGAHFFDETKKKMLLAQDVDDSDVVDDINPCPPEDEENEEENVKMSKKYSKKKMGKKYMKKKTGKCCGKMMKKENAEFLNSLRKQMGCVNPQYSSGILEDALYAPQDPNSNLSQNEPGPGEVGYAPQGRVGELPSLSDYAEWRNDLEESMIREKDVEPGSLKKGYQPYEPNMPKAKKQNIKKYTDREEKRKIAMGEQQFWQSLKNQLGKINQKWDSGVIDFDEQGVMPGQTPQIGGMPQGGAPQGQNPQQMMQNPMMQKAAEMLKNPEVQKMLQQMKAGGGMPGQMPQGGAPQGMPGQMPQMGAMPQG